MNLTSESLPKELLDEIRTGNEEKIKIVRIHDRQNYSKYKVKHKPNGNRSERKKAIGKPV